MAKNMTKENSAPAEREEVFVPRGSEREDPNLFVGLNGINYLLPKGKRSSVPLAVAEEIRRSELAREALDETMDKIQRSRA